MNDKKILLAHGSGGKMSQELLRGFLPDLANPILDRLDDAAVFEASGRLAFTTDSYTVQPRFFPGGDIGKLAVCGTVNDLAMSGAVPKYLSLAFIIEEGFPIEDLRKITASIKAAAAEAGVSIVTGDTKVVNQGGTDGIFINTAGIGIVPEGVDISAANARPDDVVIVSGPVGDHGIAVMSQREGIQFSTPVPSDCAPLNGLVATMLEACRDIRCLRDPTRGGLGTTLNDFAAQSHAGIRIEETEVPVRPAVRAACELLGLDPLSIANEGKLAAVVPPEHADTVLAAMKAHEYGREAAVIGRVTPEHPGRVVMTTSLGASRIIDVPAGELLPRIC
jgi:hydrogenase expression/formation protein HypE